MDVNYLSHPPAEPNLACRPENVLCAVYAPRIASLLREHLCEDSAGTAGPVSISDDAAGPFPLFFRRLARPVTNAVRVISKVPPGSLGAEPRARGTARRCGAFECFPGLISSPRTRVCLEDERVPLYLPSSTK